MSDGTIEKFERQLDALLENYNRLRKDNSELRGQQSVIMAERDSFRNKHQLMVDKIESIIKRLKQFGGE